MKYKKIKFTTCFEQKTIMDAYRIGIGHVCYCSKAHKRRSSHMEAKSFLRALQIANNPFFISRNFRH
jgi:hypothetical protein